MKLNEKQKMDIAYQKMFHEMGKRFQISGRVLRHVRAVHNDRYKDLPFKEVRHGIAREASIKLSAIEASSRSLFIETARLFLSENEGLEDAVYLIGKLGGSGLVRQCIHSMDRIGYYKSIKRFMKRMTQEQLKEIVESNP